MPLTTVSPNWNPTIVMFRAEVGFVSKHNVVSFHCPCRPFIAPLAAQSPVVSGQGCRMVSAIGPSFPPASSDRSVSLLLRFTLTDFLKVNPQSLQTTILPRSNSETWSKDSRCLPRGISKLLTKKKIAILQIANLFSPYITFEGGAAVPRDVRLRYSTNDLHISSPSTHDVYINCMLPSGYCILCGASSQFLGRTVLERNVLSPATFWWPIGSAYPLVTDGGSHKVEVDIVGLSDLPQFDQSRNAGFIV
ncbi:hypothetical protein TNCV_2483631 [Trichonephila clavipes]|uniref:Uncharacterized protein n=1 Tax=Trichonephila clavipes TaxID=2585209 RepID=A0A8X6VZG8_TRICX|nr:hypothetical protein TNCV_2483631 [Trichonephila clavipes]